MTMKLLPTSEGKDRKKKCCLIFQKLQPCTKWRKTIIINVIFITKYDVKKKIHFLGENVFKKEKKKEGVPNFAC